VTSEHISVGTISVLCAKSLQILLRSGEIQGRLLHQNPLCRQKIIYENRRKIGNTAIALKPISPRTFICAGTIRTVLMKFGFNKNEFRKHFDLGLIRRVLKTSI
jgi:hypothetical protein